MIHAFTTHQTEEARAQLLAQGFILADSPRLIIVGRMICGTPHDSYPAQELVAADDNVPIMQTVAQNASGYWLPFDGVKFVS